jgi:hypothetical protein
LFGLERIDDGQLIVNPLVMLEIPAFLVDVLAQCRHQIGPHLEHTGLGFVEAEIIERAASRRSDMARPVFISSALFPRSFRK